MGLCSVVISYDQADTVPLLALLSPSLRSTLGRRDHCWVLVSIASDLFGQ